MLGHVTTITQKNNFVLSNIDPGAGGTSTKKVKIGNLPNIFDDDCSSIFSVWLKALIYSRKQKRIPVAVVKEGIGQIAY